VPIHQALPDALNIFAQDGIVEIVGIAVEFARDSVAQPALGAAAHLHAIAQCGREVCAATGASTWKSASSPARKFRAVRGGKSGLFSKRIQRYKTAQLGTLRIEQDSPEGLASHHGQINELPRTLARLRNARIDRRHLLRKARAQFSQWLAAARTRSRACG